MLKNYFKIAYRNLWNHKAFAVINLSGLAVGISSSLIIIIHFIYIISYDRFHENIDQIYRVYKERITPNGTQDSYDTWVPLLEQMKMDFPQIQEGTRYYSDQAKIRINDQSFEEEVSLVDPAFFEIFTFQTKGGNQSQSLNGFNSVVISQNLAEKYFGQGNPIGQPIRIQNRDFQLDKEYLVSAILEPYPSNSYIRPSLVIPFESVPVYSELENLWSSSFIETFITIDSEEKNSMEASFPAFVAKTWDEKTRNNTNLKLMSFDENYETFIGDLDNAYTLLYVAMGILLIAMINFINLSTARSIDRAKEIGVKKVLGARLKQLRQQFLIESVITTFVSLLLSLVLVSLALPLISELINQELLLQSVLNPKGVGMIVGITLTVSLLAGSYPAFHLSKFKTVGVLKGQINHAENRMFRNGLVVFQFAMATILIISTLVIRSQIQYMTNSNMGFDPADLVILPIEETDFKSDSVKINRVRVAKTELEKLTVVNTVSLSRNIPTMWSYSFTFVRPEEWDGDPLRMRYTFMDDAFFEAYDIGLVGGSNFTNDLVGDSQNAVILNEAALDAFGWREIEDQRIKVGRNSFKAIGLVRNFHFESLRHEIQPTLHFFRDQNSSSHRYLTIRLNSGNRISALQEIESLWYSVNPEIAFTPLFLDAGIEALYEEEQRLAKLSGLFTIVGIVIALIGLYGLSTHLIFKRQKEISIRKVAGASISSLLQLLGGYFMRLMLIAFGLGSIISYLLLETWLDNFVYRMDTPLSLFSFSLIAILVLVLLTVSFQSWKVARSNPVEYLRQE